MQCSVLTLVEPMRACAQAMRSTLTVDAWIVLLAGVLACSSPALAAEAVGKAVLINTSVTGSSGSLAVSSPVHRDERIRTSATGLGEFVFRDGTKLAVGAGSSVVIDKFVFNDDKTAKTLSIKAAKGSFRWISGNSKSSAYNISTPVGTLAIRGTAFDFYVGSNGMTAVVLLNGSARFCGRGGCQDLKRRCDAIVANRQGVTSPRRADRRLLTALGNQRALPFQTGDQRLSRRLKTGGSSCLTTASLTQPQRTIRGVSPSPEAPSTPDAPTPSPGGKKGNNGKGNGAGDGSPNGRDDTNG